MIRSVIVIAITSLVPAWPLVADEERPIARTGSNDERTAMDLQTAMQDILKHYYSVKVTMQYCAARFDDMQPDLRASHSQWVQRNSQIVSAAREVILEHQFSFDQRALDQYLMSQIKPGLHAIRSNDSTEQKLHCFNIMVGIEDGAIDISKKYKKEYELLRSL